MNIILTRLIDTGRETIGTLFLADASGYVVDRKTIYTLEPPWKENRRNISCIPTGVYTVTHNNSPRFGPTIRVNKVPGRSGILFHAGNDYGDTQGCILPGASLTAETQKVLNSREALSWMLEHLPKTGGRLIINNAWR